MTIRIFKPLARTVTAVLSDGARVPLEHELEGVWVGESVDGRGLERALSASSAADVPDYRVEVDYGEGAITVDDPYRFLPTLGEMDLHLVNEGRHELLWTVLGARVHHYRSVDRRRLRYVVRGLGARRARRTARGRLQQLGRPRAPDAPARRVRASGSCSCPGVGAGAGYKYVDPRRRRRVAREGRPDGVLGRD